MPSAVYGVSTIGKVLGQLSQSMGLPQQVHLPDPRRHPLRWHRIPARMMGGRPEFEVAMDMLPWRELISFVRTLGNSVADEHDAMQDVLSVLGELVQGRTPSYRQPCRDSVSNSQGIHQGMNPRYSIIGAKGTIEIRVDGLGSNFSGSGCYSSWMNLLGGRASCFQNYDPAALKSFVRWVDNRETLRPGHVGIIIPTDQVIAWYTACRLRGVQEW